MKEGSVLNDRFVLRDRIGRGGTSETWRAEDRRTGSEVAVKLLSFGLLEEWKAFELFEREAEVLKGIRCDGVPAYVDFFKVGKGAATRFVLVQQFVNGKSLHEMVESGWRGTEAEICAIGVKLLRIVDHIHSLRPPIVHRDINPRNVIIADDGRVFLVDFGGVQDSARVTAASGATVIGTPGYMPMEQFVGKATSRSDLYACAATLLFLLTHRNPQDLPVKGMKIDAASVVECAPGLARVLDSWLEPDEGRRTLSVAEAIDCLEGRLPARRPSRAPARRPSSDRETEGEEEQEDLTPPRFSRIKVAREGEAVILTIPEKGPRGKGPAFAGFSGFWLFFIGIWTFMAVKMGAPVMALFSIPFWLVGFGMVSASVKGFLGRTVLRLDPAAGIVFKKGLLIRKTVTASFHEVGRLATVEAGTFNHQPLQDLRLDVGARGFTFGRNLSSVEKQWLKRNVNSLVRRMGSGGA
jgi:eukaryotic-like serine/threonine-protein kinase